MNYQTKIALNAFFTLITMSMINVHAQSDLKPVVSPEDLDLKWAIKRVESSTFVFTGKMVQYRKIGTIPLGEKAEAKEVKAYWGRVKITTILRNKDNVNASFVDFIWTSKNTTSRDSVSGRTSIYLTDEEANGLESMWSMRSENIIHDAGTGIPLISMLFSCNVVDPIHIKALSVLDAMDKQSGEGKADGKK
jgi:hypothetical protein